MVFASQPVALSDRDYEHLPTPFDVVPSFYSGASETKIIVSGSNLGAIHTVKVFNTQLTCGNLTALPDAITCVLPVLPEEITGGIYLMAYAGDGPKEAFVFIVELIPTIAGKDPVKVLSATPATVTAGTRVKLTLSRPLPSAHELPWRPVLVSEAGYAAPFASVSAVDWDKSLTSVSFDVHCTFCTDGEYTVTLGESSAYLSAAVLPSAATVTYTEPACDFIGEIHPRSLGGAAFGGGPEGASAYIYASLKTQPPSGQIYGTLAADKTAAEMPGAQTLLMVNRIPSVFGPGFLRMEPSAVAQPLAGDGQVTLHLTSRTGGVVDLRCAMRAAFEVTPQSSGVYFASTSPRLLFTGADAPAQTVLIRGGGALRDVTVVLVVQPDVQPSEPCGDVRYVTNGIECSFPADKIKPGQVRLLGLNSAGAAVASITGLFAVATMAPAVVAPQSVPTGTEVAVSVTLKDVLPTDVPISLWLAEASGAVLPIAAEFDAVTNTATFTNAVFAAEGEAHVVLTEFAAEQLLILASLTIVAGPAPAAVVADVLPRVTYVPPPLAGDATVELVLRLVVEQLTTIAHRLQAISVDGSSDGVTVLSLSDAIVLRVRVAWPAAGTTARHSVQLLDALRQPIAVKEDAFTVVVRADLVLPLGADSVAFVELGAPPALRFFFANGPTKDIVVTAASGAAVAAVDITVLPDGVTAYTVHMADACIGCLGDVETLMFTLSGLAPMERAVQYVRAPRITALQPAGTLDFSATRQCLEFSAVVTGLTTTAPVALAFPGSQRVQARDVRVDIRRSTVSGCFVCVGCVSGTFAAALVPAYGAAYGAVADEAHMRTIIAGDSSDGPDPEPPGPKPEPDGGSPGLGAGVIALIAIGSVAIVAAIGYAVYRVVARKRSLEPAFDEGLLNGV
jgi:hypothetical protein